MTKRMLTLTATLAAALVGAIALSGCTATEPVPSASGSASSSPSETPSPTPDDPLAGLSLEQKVGQLFIVGTGAGETGAAALDAVTTRHAGGVFLHGRSQAGAQATAAIVAPFTAAAAPGGIPLWVAADQEGGEVQTLSGPGFDTIPYGLTQASRQPAALQDEATRWSRQLAAAGVNLNLAPVADIVTDPHSMFENAPIGALQREYGFDQQTVATMAGAFANGMRASGVLPTFKHFPGLGRVTRNTDTSANVHDTVIAADAPDIAVYRDLLAGGPALAMVSSAIYDRIDGSAPAVFSPTVVGLLRSQVGFGGVIITDDVSSAAAVKGWAPADRAVLALQAGVDVVLVSSDPGVFPAMYDAVLAKAQSDPAFAAVVDAAARRVVEQKKAFPAAASPSPAP